MSTSNFLKKSLKQVISSLPIVLTFALGVPIFGMALSEGSKLVGLKPVSVEVVGTGSMYPSLFWDKAEGGPEEVTKTGVEEYRSAPLMYKKFTGFTILVKTYLKRRLEYGDMVAFQSEATRAVLAKEGRSTDAGFIKRIIAKGGDSIELRDGYVIKNGSLLNEPYIHLPRSTYGGSTLLDCQKLVVPPGHYFVLGDNRKVSSDSRFDLGLVKEEDITYVLPYDLQGQYRSLWRDTSKDQELLGTPTLSANEFYNLVNVARAEAKVKPLTATPLLAKSASLRGAKLLADKNTPYTMQSAMRDAGYTNIISGEFVSYGHFSATELMQNLLAFGDTSKQLLNSDYQEIGLTATTRDVDGCPTQVIVGHLGGYIPASYEADVIESWQKLRDNLSTVIPSWEKGIGQEGIDQDKLGELLTILRRRLALANEILGAMQRRAWLSSDQEARIKLDSQDASRAEVLADELNRH